MMNFLPLVKLKCHNNFHRVISNSIMIVLYAASFFEAVLSFHLLDQLPDQIKRHILDGFG